MHTYVPHLCVCRCYVCNCICCEVHAHYLPGGWEGPDQLPINRTQPGGGQIQQPTESPEGTDQHGCVHVHTCTWLVCLLIGLQYSIVVPTIQIELSSPRAPWETFRRPSKVWWWCLRNWRRCTPASSTTRSIHTYCSHNLHAVTPHPLACCVCPVGTWPVVQGCLPFPQASQLMGQRPCVQTALHWSKNWNVSIYLYRMYTLLHYVEMVYK